MKSYADIKERSSSLLINTVIAYVIFVAVTNRWVPSGGIESVWLFSCLSYWFLALLSAPWFVPPRDALVAGVGALLILTTLEIPSELLFAKELESIRWGGVIYSAVIILSAVIALFLHNENAQSPVGKLFSRLCGLMGKGEVLFTFPATISILTAYQDSFSVMAWLFLYWVAITVLRPVETIHELRRKLEQDQKLQTAYPLVGTVTRIDHPNIIRVQLSSADSWKSNHLFTASVPDGHQKYVIALFSQTQGEEVVGTGLCVATAQEELSLPTGGVVASHDEERTQKFIENMSGAKNSALIGFVVEHSTIGILRFEISSHSHLKEGEMIFVRIDKDGAHSDVFYQIIGAETSEENFNQNPRGTHIVIAAQLGTYSADAGFQKYSWLPSMNAPVFSAGSREFSAPIKTDREWALGKVPSTNIEAIANIDELVEYHTAILGVTGTGKTEVALDFIKEAHRIGTKIFCVDFTGEYKHRLAGLNPIFPAPDSKTAKSIEGLLATIDAYGFKAGDQKAKVKTLLDQVRSETRATIDAFLREDGTNLAIFELAEISNSKTGLRLTEIYISAIMDWAREHRQARQVLICLEEAHTIVPEAYGSGLDGETKWVVERIGQIALQGRKYGVGLLVITQRTALVSKTILSQCNTFLTHSLFDQTSLTFLQNVYSAQHIQMIPNLGRFEFLAFGKAIKAERPIILKRDFDPAKLAASQLLNVASEGLLEKEGPYIEEAVDAPSEPTGPRLKGFKD